MKRESGGPPREGNGDGGFGGGRDREQQRAPSTPQLQGIIINGEKTMDMMVPGTKVGYIIGKGGEMIRTLQERASVKMTIFQQTSEASDAPKQLRIVGAPDKVDYAKELINDLLTEKELESMKTRTTKPMPGGMGGGPGNFGGGGNSEYGSSRGGGGGANAEVAVPPQYIGLVIGKGGESIKRIQAETGCKVQFDTQKNDERGNKICQISGPPDCVKRAEELIEDIIKNAANYKSNRMRESGGDEIRMPVPANRTGAVIGRGGETIRQLKQQSGCEIELDKNAKIGPGDDKVFIIRGPSDRIQYAQQLINDKVQGNSSNEGNSNNYGYVDCIFLWSFLIAIVIISASSGDYAWPANYFQQESSSQSNESEFLRYFYNSPHCIRA